MRCRRPFSTMPKSRIYVYHKNGEYLTYQGWMHPLQALVCAYERENKRGHNVCDRIGGKEVNEKFIFENYNIEEKDGYYLLGDYKVSKDED